MIAFQSKHFWDSQQVQGSVMSDEVFSKWFITCSFGGQTNRPLCDVSSFLILIYWVLNQIAGVEISQKDATPSVFVIGNKSRSMMAVALNPHLQAQTNSSTGKCLTPKQNSTAKQQSRHRKAKCTFRNCIFQCVFTHQHVWEGRLSLSAWRKALNWHFRIDPRVSNGIKGFGVSLTSSSRCQFWCFILCHLMRCACLNKGNFMKVWKAATGHTGRRLHLHCGTAELFSSILHRCRDCC